MKKYLKRTIIALTILLICLIAITTAYLYSKKPQLSGNIAIKQGINNDTQIIFDNFGVPHIYAQTETDAYFALGYVHAQDRLFQMELLRRLASGRLSEIFGKDLLPVDILFRTISLSQHADQILNAEQQQQNEDYYKAANAYIDGINNYIQNKPKPIEFDLLQIQPQPFTLKDCLLIGGYMAFSFSEAFKQDPLATFIQQKYGQQYLNDLVTSWNNNDMLVPTDNANNKTQTKQPNTTQQQTNNSNATYNGFAQLINDIITNLPAPVIQGSNAWTIAPQKTKNHKVIFSNDTHIGFGQPCIWYEAHLNYPNTNFYGSFLAGVPVALLGHNPNFAWGLTMFENDDIDFYLEKTNPNNNNQVWQKDHWNNLTQRPETIHIKDQPDTTIQVRASQHGVIVNDIKPYFNNNNKQPIAMWWVYTLFPNAPLQALYQLSHTQNVNDATPHLAKIHAPGLNIMMGDNSGNIAWWAVAKIPKRKQNINTSLFIDGANSDNDITQWYDFQQNPHQINPTTGFIASANTQANNPTTQDIPGYYQAVDRVQRITSQLQQNNSWTAQNTRQLINDNQSNTYPTILQQFLPLIKPNNPTEQQAYLLLQQWNGQHNTQSIEPTIFYRFWWRLHQLTFEDEMGKQQLANFLSIAISKKTMPHLLQQAQSPWWDNQQTTQKETRDQLLQTAFSLAIKDLIQQLGNDTKQWQWQKVHLLEHQHPIGKAVKPLAKWLNVGTFGVAGGKEVINNLDFNMDSSGIYLVKSGPALRRIVDFSQQQQATSCLPTGQSGNPLSPHYRDQAQLFANGQDRPELMDKPTIEQQQKGTLWLRKKQ